MTISGKGHGAGSMPLARLSCVCLINLCVCSTVVDPKGRLLGHMLFPTRGPIFLYFM